MSAQECTPAPKNAVKVSAPANLISLMPKSLVVRVYSTDGSAYFEVESSGFLRAESCSGEIYDLPLEHAGAKFHITHQSDKYQIGLEVLSVMDSHLDADFIIPFGTAELVPSHHTGAVYTVPPRGVRTYMDDAGKIVGCNGLVCVKKSCTRVEK